MVGMALSQWEGSQSELITLFELICGVSTVDSHSTGNGKLLRDTFIIAPREAKNKMVMEAMNEHKKVHPLNAKKIKSSLKRYGKLTKTRNEIAHGVVTTAKYSVDDKVIIDGTFLMPASRAGIRINPTPKYHLTEQDIAGFIRDVKSVRDDIYTQMKLLREMKYGNEN